MTEALLLDCDPGHDDVLAILTAARYGDLVGITTVAGNASLEHTTRNALVTCDLAGIDVPVHAGAAGPLSGPTRDAVHVHGDTGLAGVDIPAPSRDADGDDATTFIVETVRATPGIWLVPVGPLTNIALALQRAPEVVDAIAGISMMGGGTFGNATPVAEFNIWADPEAAEIVFASGAPIRMCGLDLTHQVCADDKCILWIQALHTPLADFVAGLLKHYSATIRQLVGEDLAALHDPCAVLAATHPEAFTFERHHVRVELDGTRTRGMTVIDRRVRGRGTVDVAWSCESATVLDLITQAIVSA